MAQAINSLYRALKLNKCYRSNKFSI